MTREEAVAALESLPAIKRILVGALKPTDVIIVNCSEYISMESAARMREYLRQVWPDNKIVVLEKGVELTIADGGDEPAHVEGGDAGPARWRCKGCGKERRRGKCLHCGNTDPITDEPRVSGVVR